MSAPGPHAGHAHAGATAGSVHRQAERLKWAMLVRQTEVSRAAAALKAPASLGAVVTGPPGVGKSFLASAVLSELGPAVFPLRIRTASSAATPYASLGPLIARVPQDVSSSPTKLLVAVERMLSTDARGLPAVLVVEFGGPMDEASAGVILHLLLGGTARLLAVAQHAADLPADLLRLTRAGRLDEIPLTAIGIRETRRLVSALVDGHVAASAVAEFHFACHGNPAMVHGMVRREHASGNLHRRGTVWTLDGSVEHESSAGTDEIIRARWAREPQDVREVIEHLAVARRIPISGLAGLFGSEVLVDMEDRHLVAVDSSPRRCAYLREPRMAELVRGRLGPDRHRELALLAQLDGTAEGAGLDAEDLVSYAEWTLAGGGAVAPALVVKAARTATELFEPRRALGLLDAAGALEGAAGVDAAIQRAAALSLLERREEACTVLADLPGEAVHLLGAVDRARLAAAKSELLTWMPARGDAIEPLHEARDALALGDGLPGDSRGSRTAEQREAAELLDLAEFRIRAFRGEYREIADDLEEAVRRADAGQSFRGECTLILALAWAALGREADAAALLDALRASAPRGLREDSSLAIAFLVWIVNGDWRRCVDRFEAYIDRGGRRLSMRGGLVELFLALALVMAGKGDEALVPLLNATAQLEEFPAQNALRAAYAATAFAYAQVGDAAEAERFLDRAATVPGTAPWHLEFMADYCELMARRWLGVPGAHEALLAHAELEEAAGRITTAGLAVFGASVAGSERELLWIERLGHHRQGPLAQLMTAVAAATRRADPRGLLDAAESAHAMRLDAVEARCAALALDSARDRGEAATAGQAQTRLDRLARSLPVLPIVPRVPAPVLTGRERQIAVMAANGASNRDIADEIGVSVRTVEGHLYQVFMKLGVSSRSGLDGLV